MAIQRNTLTHVIGNSHIGMFSGSTAQSIMCAGTNFSNRYFKSHNLGPVIAYNLYEHYMPKIREYVYQLPQGSNIILVVGEVDCRFHLPKQADIQQRTDEDITKECIVRLMRCYDEIAAKGYRIIGFGTHPTTLKEQYLNEDGPIYGDWHRRNNICLIWNSELELQCKSRCIKYFSIYDLLVDSNNRTRTEYYVDYCHLDSVKVWDELVKRLKFVWMG